MKLINQIRTFLTECKEFRLQLDAIGTQLSSVVELTK